MKRNMYKRCLQLYTHLRYYLKSPRRSVSSIREANTFNSPAMAEREVDPTISRAIRLMMTRTKESQEQLRLMLEDEIRKRTGKTMGHLLRPADSVMDVTDSNSRKKNLELRTVSLHIEETPKDSHMNEEFDDEDNDSEINLEILEEDLTCIVCRGMDVAPRNRLIECTECHSLYHQECHQPPVGEADMEDPRSIWYCTDCLKTINRAPFQMPSTSVNSKNGSSGAMGMAGLATSIQAAHHSSKQTYMSSGGKPGLVSSFPHGNKSFGGSTVSSSACIPKQIPAQSSTGTASNANISSIATVTSTPTTAHTAAAPAATTVTTTTAASSSKSSMVPKVNVISADKRLANMKKKAAKLQEKRKHAK